MEMGVDTTELRVAARTCADAADSTAALAAVLAREGASARAWACGALADAAERFFTTLAWAATTGGAELSGLGRRLAASGDDYDLAELLISSQYGLDPSRAAADAPG